MASNEVRIIGGKWKGRKLRFPDSAGLRPTLGRVRGSLFNWLAADIHGAVCLDLYAGSGALGFEALSRGASELVLVERNRKVAATLARNANLLAANAKVITATATKFLNTTSGPWDLILLDPPFESLELDMVLELIATRELLTSHGQVYFERPKKEPLPIANVASTATTPNRSGWRLVKHSHAGDSQFGLLARH
jgi:16S rRNA (guanine966-N2)-methyltransferase